jgi:hypothetical protein
MPPAARTGTDTPDAAPVGVQATFTSLYGDYFSRCSSCHTPTAPGRTPDTEMNLDFSTKATAHNTITTKMAAGLMGNFMDCNGVPFVNNAVPAPERAGQSLLLASLDQATRNAFDYPAVPDCGGDAIADQTLKVGMPPSAAFIDALKAWLAAGAPNN